METVIQKQQENIGEQNDFLEFYKKFLLATINFPLRKKD